MTSGFTKKTEHPSGQLFGTLMEGAMKANSCFKSLWSLHNVCSATVGYVPDRGLVNVAHAVFMTPRKPEVWVLKYDCLTRCNSPTNKDGKSLISDLSVWPCFLPYFLGPSIFWSTEPVKTMTLTITNTSIIKKRDQKITGLIMVIVLIL